jgi:hypothetical protein
MRGTTRARLQSDGIVPKFLSRVMVAFVKDIDLLMISAGASCKDSWS